MARPVVPTAWAAAGSGSASGFSGWGYSGSVTLTPWRGLTMLDEYYQFRRQLVDALERDLLGPEADDEVIAGPPTMKYIVGVLFPRDSDRADPAQNLDEGSASDTDADDSGAWDPAVSMSYVRYPCSMGLTMAVDSTATQRIMVHVDGARYVPVEQQGEEAVAGAAARGARVHRPAGAVERAGDLAQDPARSRSARDRHIKADPRQIGAGRRGPGAIPEGPSCRRARPGLRHPRAHQYQETSCLRA